MGSVFQDKKNGRYYIRYDLPPGPNGKRRQKMISCGPDVTSPRQAAKVLAQVVADLSRGAYVDPSTLRFSELLDRWLDHRRDQVADLTMLKYTRMVNGLIKPNIGFVPLCDLSPLHIEQFYQDLRKEGRSDGSGGLSPKTIRDVHGIVHAALVRAVRWRMIPTNPAEAIDPPRVPRKEARATDRGGILRLLEEITKSDYRIPILIAMGTGMRRAELCGLKWTDFSDTRRVLVVRRSIAQLPGRLVTKGTKSDTPRVLPVTDTLSEVLLQQYEHNKAARRRNPEHNPGDYICIHQDGRPFSPDSLTKAFWHIADHAKVNITLHGLRHTFASELLAAGVPSHVVSELLGHANISTTHDKYGHVMPPHVAPALDIIEQLLRPQKPEIRVLEGGSEEVGAENVLNPTTEEAK